MGLAGIAAYNRTMLRCMSITVAFRAWRLLTWSTLLLLCLSDASAQITGPEAEVGEVEFDRWYAVLIEEQPSGWAHAWVTRSQGVLTTAMRMEMTLARGPVTMIVGVDSRFEETDDGRPLAATTQQNLGAMTITQTMRFTPAGVELVSRQGGTEQRQFFAPSSQSWLPPAAASRYVEQQLARGATQIAFRTLDPAAGPQPIDMQIQVQGETHVEVMGRQVPAIRWAVQTSQLPGVTMTEYVDHQGRAIRTNVAAMPGMTITLVQEEKATALAGPTAGAADEGDAAGSTEAQRPASGPSSVSPPGTQMTDRMVIAPDRPLPYARVLRAASYRLRFDPGEGDGAMQAPALPRSGYQRVVWADERTAVVVVNLDEPVNPGEDVPGHEHRRSSLMLNYRDEAVLKLLREALPEDAKRLPAARRAEHLRRFVHRFIEEKDLSTGFATAAEVARSGQGDCTEHAVLLAALLRGSGIPSRTVSGLVYVDSFLSHQDVFGYHMWTQAWLSDGPGGEGGRWVDLDATLAEAAFDAGHIALATSAQDEAQTFNDMAKILPWMGRLSIEIVEPPAAVRWHDE